jgi:hypothetical protein
MTHLQKIQKSNNMVAISQIILSDVWAEYSVKFAKEHRPFVRANESHQIWVEAVNSAYANDIAKIRKSLFNCIPLRFRITRMYGELNAQIN